MKKLSVCLIGLFLMTGCTMMSQYKDYDNTYMQINISGPSEKNKVKSR